MDEDPEDVPRLRPETLKALEDFYTEQLMKECPRPPSTDSDQDIRLDENWQLSQFWYDEKTTDTLAREALRVAGDNGRIACVSCPTIYRRLRLIKPSTCTATLFEYDQRFRLFGNDFVPYDYNAPLDLDQIHECCYDIVIADPPFLSRECILNVAKTIEFLRKNSIIVCTGLVMETYVEELLGLKRSQFKPMHERHLGNEFACFANYNIDKFLSPRRCLS